jgi:hypothetical protein
VAPIMLQSRVASTPVDVIARPEDAMSLWDRAKPGAEPGKFECPTPAERRTKERKRQRLVGGFVSSARIPRPRPCTVCDMSTGGAKIELWDDTFKTMHVGDRLTLYIPVDRGEIDAEVRWRKDNTVGLRFTSAFRPSTPSRPSW